MAKTASFRDFPKPVLKKTRKGVPRALLAYVNANGKRWSKEFPLATRASVIIAWQEEDGTKGGDRGCGRDARDVRGGRGEVSRPARRDGDDQLQVAQERH